MKIASKGDQFMTQCLYFRSDAQDLHLLFKELF